MFSMAQPQFSLYTARIASCSYPALGGADARNEGEALRAAPPCDPPWRRDFLRKLFFKYSWNSPVSFFIPVVQK